VLGRYEQSWTKLLQLIQLLDQLADDKRAGALSGQSPPRTRGRGLTETLGLKLRTMRMWHYAAMWQAFGQVVLRARRHSDMETPAGEQYAPAARIGGGTRLELFGHLESVYGQQNTRR
jgi:hypothetical protein